MENDADEDDDDNEDRGGCGLDDGRPARLVVKALTTTLLLQHRPIRKVFVVVSAIRDIICRRIFIVTCVSVCVC